MQKLLLIGIGGFCGSISRYLITLLTFKIFPNVFPFGTLVVNVVGCFFMGMILGGYCKTTDINDHLKAFLTVGILGGLTTFSAFSYDTFELYLDSKYFLALFNIILNVTLSLISFWFGRMLILKYFLS